MPSQCIEPPSERSVDLTRYSRFVHGQVAICTSLANLFTSLNQRREPVQTLNSYIYAQDTISERFASAHFVSRGAHVARATKAIAEFEKGFRKRGQ
jgi:hypothetical protein